MGVKYLGMEKFAFADVYNMFLKYKDMDSSDLCWEALLNEGKQLTEKYENCELIRLLVAGVVADMELKLNKMWDYEELNRNILEKIMNKE